MAKWVPEHVEARPGLTSYFATVTTAKSIRRFLRAGLRNTPIRIWGVDCYVTEVAQTCESPSQVTLAAGGNTTAKKWARVAETLKRRFENVHVWFERDIQRFDVRGHVEHEWKLSGFIVEDGDCRTYVVTEDNIRPNWPYEEFFETRVERAETAWDADLCDEITVTRILARREYATKDEARRGHRQWVRKYRREYARKCDAG